MATSPAAISKRPAARILGTGRITVLVLLVAVLAACVTFSWLTRNAAAGLSFLQAQNKSSAASLVDTSPWQTADTLASMAVSAEEQRLARQAENLADHEVDQTFAAALRQARLDTQHKTLTGNALVLKGRVAQLQQLRQQDQALVDKLAAAVPAAKNGALPESAALQVAKAQLGLDTDELNDAQRDLARASGDQSVQIQAELAAHEQSMHKYDSEVASGQLAIVSVAANHTLAARIRAWLSQRQRAALVNQARQQALHDAATINAQHDALEARLNAAAGPAAGSSTAQITDLNNRSLGRQILSIDDDRIQTDQQLAEIYDKWGDQVLLQHGLLLHLILSSAGLVLAIVIGMLLGDALVRQLFEHPRLDYRQTQILRTIFEVGVQVVGVLLIALVLFGPPKQTATAIGLVSAALTISLQDYILAFFGWFILVGRNGVRVGDMIEVNGVCGEVIDIGLMSTTLLETSSISSQNQLTGRRVSFLNSFAIRGQFFNFSSKGQWLWDDMTITVPADKDFYALASAIEKIARDETEESARIAEKEWNATIRRSGLGHLSADPVLMLLPASPGIAIQLRYVTSATNRLKIRDHINRKVIELLQQKPHPTEPAAVTA